jgi:1-acyl-sn-glycerol-3-phosphate acyltransferase
MNDSLDGTPGLIERCGDRLSAMERAQIRFIRGTFEPGVTNSTIRWLQRNVGATWIHLCTRHLRHIYGLERLPKLDLGQSYVLVCNHRSFFDMYVVTAELVRRGLQHRIAFPVRANFFYDSAAGFCVNGIMSFFAMYPPIFRDRKKLVANVASLEELSALLRRGGMLAGLHPEGTRKKDDDPYTFLPAQRGVGRVIYDARVPVIPVFINGLVNDLRVQVKSNFDRSGRRVIAVFGEPVPMDDLFARPSSPATDRAIADRAVQAISQLGTEERRIRAELGAAVLGQS